MNENARKWVEALRSGEYKQGQRRLRVEDRFCCLGVACDLYANETGNGSWIPGFRFVAGEYADNIALPAPVRSWLGLERASGQFDGRNGSHTDALSDHNDQGETFDQIADLIEGEPKGLFKAPS